MSGNLARLGFTGANLPDWHSEGACNERTDLDWYSDIPDEIAAVKDVCAGCPIPVTCLQDAIDRREAWGIWGGLDPEERAEYAKKLGAEAPTIVRHGDRTRYVGTRNTPGCRCDLCTRAHADYEHLRRTRTKAGWKPAIRDCAYCSGAFTEKMPRQRYCTPVCSKADRADQTHRQLLARRCNCCGAPMQTKLGKYCSDACTTSGRKALAKAARARKKADRLAAKAVGVSARLDTAA
jgi:hypothetical protein